MYALFKFLLICQLYKFTLQNNLIENDDMGNEINFNNVKKIVKVYWNMPTFQCNSYKLNFTELFEKYSIEHNDNDQFRGDEINILYDPGSFPAILKSGTAILYRNGGIPQQGNLTYHLSLFKNTVDILIPDVNFKGLAVIDFESWRPIFRQNFGSLQPYKDVSIALEKRLYPFLPDFWIEKQAVRRFEFYARLFMEETLFFAKQLRPNATWGYYGYPYCFNMTPNQKKKECSPEVRQENEKLAWLFNLTDNLHPSLYMPKDKLTSQQKEEMIEGRIDEAHRLKGYLHRKDNLPKVLPYFWIKYNDDSSVLLSKNDLFKSITTLGNANVDGLVLWGSSSDVKSKSNCMDIYQYVDDILGPILINSFL